MEVGRIQHRPPSQGGKADSERQGYSKAAGRSQGDRDDPRQGEVKVTCEVMAAEGSQDGGENRESRSKQLKVSGILSQTIDPKCTQLKQWESTEIRRNPAIGIAVKAYIIIKA